MKPGSFRTSFWVSRIPASSGFLLSLYSSQVRPTEMSCVLPPELKPKGVVVNMIPGLPAYILFMCIRHADYLNDEAKLKSLMNAVIGAVKKVILVRLDLGSLALFWGRSLEK